MLILSQHHIVVAGIHASDMSNHGAYVGNAGLILACNKS